VNTQLVFPLNIPPVRFTACAAIGLWSSGCHNNALPIIFPQIVFASGHISYLIYWKSHFLKEVKISIKIRPDYKYFMTVKKLDNR